MESIPGGRNEIQVLNYGDDAVRRVAFGTERLYWRHYDVISWEHRTGAGLETPYRNKKHYRET